MNKVEVLENGNVKITITIPMSFRSCGLRNTFSVNSLKSSHILRCNVYSLRAKFHPIRSEEPWQF